jgi:hypothetical protein
LFLREGQTGEAREPSKRNALSQIGQHWIEKYFHTTNGWHKTAIMPHCDASETFVICLFMQTNKQKSDENVNIVTPRNIAVKRDDKKFFLKNSCHSSRANLMQNLLCLVTPRAN